VERILVGADVKPAALKRSLSFNKRGACENGAAKPTGLKRSLSFNKRSAKDGDALRTLAAVDVNAMGAAYGSHDGPLAKRINCGVGGGADKVHQRLQRARSSGGLLGKTAADPWVVEVGVKVHPL